MSHEAKIHESQTKILRELLFLPKANFTLLQKATGLDSDHAKFHINRLVELEYLSKVDGKYSLSIRGKEYANKLDTDINTIERQPKSTTILIICRNKNGEKEYVAQERLKNPYYGFWGFPSGKIRWGESIYETAERETAEETSLVSNKWEHRGVYHERVKHKSTGEIVEDKIFHIMYTENISGELLTEFEGGRNKWMKLEEIKKNPKHYKSFDIEAEFADHAIPFIEALDEYDDQQF